MEEEYEEKPNIFELSGTLFAKDSKEVTSKKNGQKYVFHSIKVACEANVNGKKTNTIPEFQLAQGLFANNFEIGDKVIVRFVVLGSQVTSTFYKTENKCIYIRFADKNKNTTPDEHIPASVVPIDNNSCSGKVPDGSDETDDLPF